MFVSYPVFAVKGLMNVTRRLAFILALAGLLSAAVRAQETEFFLRSVKQAGAP